MRYGVTNEQEGLEIEVNVSEYTEEKMIGSEKRNSVRVVITHRYSGIAVSPFPTWVPNRS